MLVSVFLTKAAFFLCNISHGSAISAHGSRCKKEYRNQPCKGHAGWWQRLRGQCGNCVKLSKLRMLNHFVNFYPQRLKLTELLFCSLLHLIPALLCPVLAERVSYLTAPSPHYVAAQTSPDSSLTSSKVPSH